MRLPLLLVALGGCGDADDSDEGGGCLADVMPVGGCVMLEDGTGGIPDELVLDGLVVVSSDGGLADDACAERLDHGAGRGQIVVEDADGVRYRISLALGEAPWFHDTVEVASVRWRTQEPELFAGEDFEADLSLLDADGNVLVWVSQRPTLAQMEPPDGLGVAEGGVSCSASSECGENTWHDLQYGLDGQSGTMGTGTATEVGTAVLTFGGARRLLEPTCSETSMGSASVGLVRG